MGWDFEGGATKKTVVTRLAAGWDGTDTAEKCLAHCVRGNTFWAVVERTDKASGETFRFIACSLLESMRGFGWGSKDMTEAMGPYYFSCPIGYLDMVPEVANEKWRQGVRDFHAAQAQAKQVSEAA